MPPVCLLRACLHCPPNTPGCPSVLHLCVVARLCSAGTLRCWRRCRPPAFSWLPRCRSTSRYFSGAICTYDSGTVCALPCCAVCHPADHRSLPMQMSQPLSIPSSSIDPFAVYARRSGLRQTGSSAPPSPTVQVCCQPTSACLCAPSPHTLQERAEADGEERPTKPDRKTCDRIMERGRAEGTLQVSAARLCYSRSDLLPAAGMDVVCTEARHLQIPTESHPTPTSHPLPWPPDPDHHLPGCQVWRPDAAQPHRAGAAGPGRGRSFCGAGVPGEQQTFPLTVRWVLFGPMWLHLMLGWPSGEHRLLVEQVYQVGTHARFAVWLRHHRSAVHASATLCQQWWRQPINSYRPPPIKSASTWIVAAL